MKRKTYNIINKEIEDINNKLRNETSNFKIKMLIKKRDELVSDYVAIGKIPCSNITLPLKENYGGTGLPNAILPIKYGGTGNSSIGNNTILLGDGDKLSPYKIDSDIVDTMSNQIIYNKMFDDIVINNLDLSKSIKGILPISKGGTGLSSWSSDCIMGNNDYKINKVNAFSIYNNGIEQNINENENIILNWNKLFDTSDGFNINTGIYTIPQDGFYLFSWSIGYNQITTIENNYFITTCMIPNMNYKSISSVNNNIYSITSGSCIAKLNKNNSVYLVGSVNKTSSTIVNNPDITWFSGILLSSSYVM